MPDIEQSGFLMRCSPGVRELGQGFRPPPHQGQGKHRFLIRYKPHEDAAPLKEAFFSLHPHTNHHTTRMSSSLSVTSPAPPSSFSLFPTSTAAPFAFSLFGQDPRESHARYEDLAAIMSTSSSSSSSSSSYKRTRRRSTGSVLPGHSLVVSLRRFFGGL